MVQDTHVAGLIEHSMYQVPQQEDPGSTVAKSIIVVISQITGKQFWNTS